MKTADELKKEKIANQLEIENLKDFIKKQDPKNPVNELYGRLNYLVGRNAEIDNELAALGQGTGANSIHQVELAIAISSGRGGVDIRPSGDVTNETNQLVQNSQTVPRGQKFAAPDPKKPIP